MNRNTLTALALAGSLTLSLGLARCNQQASDKSSKKSLQSGGSKAGAPSVTGSHLGKPFDVKELTDVAKLLADPKAFKGIKVHIKGVVVQHCHHRRAWFAVGMGKSSKQFLRVWTLHEFQVPKDIKHGVSLAEAEGVVEIQTVPENHAKHYAREHGFFGGDPSKVSGPQFLPTLRVTGAEFKL